MDHRTIRALIWFFSGVILLFVLLMAVNFLGSRFGEHEDVPERPRPLTPGEMAQRTIDAARNSGGLPAPRTNFSSAPFSSGGVMLVKDGEFNGVAEKPKSVMDMLSELGGGDKRKPAPIKLKDEDLDKKITVGGQIKPPPVKASVTPDQGRGAGLEGQTMLTAPVDYKVFKSSETWWTFAAARKQKAGPHDFSKADLLILISVSDFPNGIFTVDSVEAGKKETVVRYRVNPMGMASETPAAQRDAYASAPVPKGKPVRLEQVP